MKAAQSSFKVEVDARNAGNPCIDRASEPGYPSDPAGL